MSVLPPKAVSVKEAADYLGLSTARVYELLAAGEIEKKYDRSKVLVTVKSMDDWHDNLPTERVAS